MKRFSVCIITVLLICLVVTPAFATEGSNDLNLASVSSFKLIGMEFPDKDYSQWLDNIVVNATTLDDLASIVKERYDDGFYSEILASKEVATKLALADEAMNRIRLSTASSSVRSVVNETQLCISLCTWDGFWLSDLLVVNDCKETAQEVSMARYPNDIHGLQDTYRHFVWNFLMTEDLSKEDARIAACDYEWARILMPYAESAYEDYIADGYSSSLAEGEAYTFAFIMRENIYAVCESNQDFFDATFGPDAIRDLWNNCYGRAYADEAAYTYSGAFNIANNAGELINDDNDVTDDHYWCVWSWDWYTA